MSTARPSSPLSSSRPFAVEVEPLESRRFLSAAALDVRINFQPADDGPTPDGYLADTGTRFGTHDNGLRYGWNADHTATAVRRSNPTSPDARFDTFNTLDRPGRGGRAPAKWSIAVPNGKYLVDLAAGDPDSAAASYGIRVQNVLAVQGTPNDQVHWIEQTVVVAVTHGRLSVSAAKNSFHNKIDFITITRVPGKTPLTTGAPLTDDLAPNSAAPRRTAAATSTAPANDYNFDGANHNAQNIALNKSNVPLYDGSGNPLGLTINNGSGGTVRFQGLETLTVGGKTYYYTWGTGGQFGQSGHVHVADMTARPSIDTSDRGGSGGLLNGRAAPDIILSDGTKKSYYVTPVSIPTDMYYIGPSDGLRHTFSNYGTPASPYSYDHTPLTWSWVNKTGGGITRIQMKRDEVLYPADVATININSQDANGVTNGSVKAMYASIWNGASRIYGWTVHSHIYQGVYTAHIRLRNG